MKRPRELAAPSRATLTWLTAAFAALQLMASPACEHTSCEEMCRSSYDDCSEDADEEQRDACAAELSRCYGICASQPLDRLDRQH
jgi:hypothetical protein